MYVGHDEVMPLPRRPPSSAPGSARRCPCAEGSESGGGEEVVSCLRGSLLRTRRALTAGSLGGQSARRYVHIVFIFLGEVNVGGDAASLGRGAARLVKVTLSWKRAKSMLVLGRNKQLS